MSLEILSKLSNKYGADDNFVLAGGGNTSYKNEAELYIKGSGTSLATITADGFVRMDRAKLAEIWTKNYSADADEREAQVLADLMNAKFPGEEKKRPSVETLLHNLFEQKYVLHGHPALVNGVTCAVDGEKVAAELFPEAVWVGEAEPGYKLAKLCKDKMDAYKKESGIFPSLLILQNHGIFFASDVAEGLDVLVDDVMGKIMARAAVRPDFTPVEADKAAAAKVAPVLRMCYSAIGAASVKLTANVDVMKYAASKEKFDEIAVSLSPDHIVYCKAEPLFISSCEADDIISAFNGFVAAKRYMPKVVFVKGVGMFTIGNTKSEAETAAQVWLDVLKIKAYSQSFGGLKPMTQYFIDFIVNWEVESYRSKVSIAAAGSKRLSGKIAIVTGSAQGFGQGIAEDLIKEGAHVIIADMNGDGAAKTAADFNAAYGANSAYAITVNVSDEDSVKAMVETTVCEFGGLDIFVNNAGIVRAGTLDEMTKSNFDLVTSVNYTAYFLCAKYSSAVMKLQRKASPEYMADIIEINSKSGLAGSNKNFAYAGSKFGGIGLTQSFALELAEFGIKVNAVCPGNFLDGPLWSDPEKGLFVQYLNAGKAPGAKTVADVKKFYESKVPLNRGCNTEDVSRAVIYAIEQKYETGQAIPVTGGQEMLK
jgi:Uncharacterized conserved protein